MDRVVGVHSVAISVLKTKETTMERRRLFSWIAGLPLFALSSLKGQEAPPKAKRLKIMMKSAWGSDDPTRASFPFAHGLALAEAGHECRFF